VIRGPALLTFARHLIAALVAVVVLGAGAGTYYLFWPLPPMFTDVVTRVEPNPVRVGQVAWLVTSYCATRPRVADISADIYNAVGRRITTTATERRYYPAGCTEQESLYPLLLPVGVILAPGRYTVVPRARILARQWLLERETVESPASTTFEVIAR
jgi:hypothetical protein